VDARIFQKNDAPVAREAVVKQLLTYIQAELKHDDMRLNSITRHILGLYHGEYGARLWRRYLSENVFKSDGCYEEVLMRALEQTKIKK
jgi:tRNA-dihydrouridine synthase A